MKKNKGVPFGNVPIKIETKPFGTNAYILICNETQKSVLIDAPGDADRIGDLLRDTELKHILLTHGHMDHTGALVEVKSQWNAPVSGHEQDSSHLPVKLDMFLKDGDQVAFGNISLDVHHTPGHTPGSLCFLYQNHLFSGDTLFPHGPGRTNTPADFKTILHSIETKLFILPDDVHVHPGHGKDTVLRLEKEEYKIFSERSHSQNLCGNVLWLK